MGKMIHFRETGVRDAVSTFKEKGGELFGQDEIVEGEIKRNKENKKTKTFDFGLKFFGKKFLSRILLNNMSCFYVSSLLFRMSV